MIWYNHAGSAHLFPMIKGSALTRLLHVDTWFEIDRMRLLSAESSEE